MGGLKKYFEQAAQIASSLSVENVEKMVTELVALRERHGRLFFLGVGGSAANCSHAVNDFRKIAGIEAYAPTDNVSELTARTNDEGWPTTFSAWLQVSRAGKGDAIFVMSVGGGDKARNISPNLVEALDYAGQHGLRILGIVGRDGGETAKKGHAVVVVPTVDPELVTPHTESFHAVIWHALVSHPQLKQAPNKWESSVRK
jgi:D-sedoheptulose 7-phosphate isomerase